MYLDVKVPTARPATRSAVWPVGRASSLLLPYLPTYLPCPVASSLPRCLAALFTLFSLTCIGESLNARIARSLIRVLQSSCFHLRACVLIIRRLYFFSCAPTRISPPVPPELWPLLGDFLRAGARRSHPLSNEALPIRSGCGIHGSPAIVAPRWPLLLTSCACEDQSVALRPWRPVLLLRLLLRLRLRLRPPARRNIGPATSAVSPRQTPAEGRWRYTVY